jgi:NAD(P)H-nitrite reductase large subunit
MKSDSPVASYTTNGIKFEDGTEVEADVIVLCTGYAVCPLDHLSSC